VTEPDEDWFDPDIAAMKLEYFEKSGLQIYRNYTRAFEEQAIKRFVEALDLEPLNLTDFKDLVALILSEEVRFLPVIVCAFADDVLKATFKDVLPDRIPGGKGSMLGAYGVLSDLSKRIQLAYAFDILSRDLMEELDRLRTARNAISHSWNIDSLKDFFTKGRLADMHRMEEVLAERKDPDGGAFARIRAVGGVPTTINLDCRKARLRSCRLQPRQESKIASCACAVWQASLKVAQGSINNLSRRFTGNCQAKLVQNLNHPSAERFHDQDPNRTSHPNFKCALELPATAIILVHRRNPTTLTRPARACAERRIRCPSRQRVSLTHEGLQILELARNAQRLFERQEPRQKRRLLNFILSNCTREDGEVVATFRQPFDLLAETTDIEARHGAGNMAKSAKSEIWLPFLDTYRTMCLASQPDFRRVLAGVLAMELAA
jgi:hypothetical protein